MFATQVLQETCLEDKSDDENQSGIIGILTIDNKQHEIKKGDTSIGRDPATCTIVIENFTVSKLHAVIESEGRDDTFIYDVASTNQTKLGKKSLKPHCRYKLDDGSIITLGNVVGTFTFPLDVKNDCLKAETITPPSSDGKNSTPDVFDELGDIFDAATQVTVSQPSTSKDILNFEKLPESFKAFKVPKAVTAAKAVNLSPSPRRDCFDEVTQCQLYSQELPIHAQHHLLENSIIFNLSTQCPISPIHLSTEEEKSKTPDEGKTSEVDKIKSLLNDGQDEVLCTFMSMHSPNGENIIRKIKAEVEGEGILNAETQVTAEVNQGNNEIEQLRDLMTDKCFGEEFCPKQPDSNLEVVENNTSLRASQHEGEDFVCTQRFCEEGKTNDGAIEVNSDESFLEITLDSPIPNYENLVATQNFHTPEECQVKTIEDIISTQIYQKEKEEERGTAQTTELSATVDLTDMTNDDDFIETQVYASPKETVPLSKRKSNKSEVVRFPEGSDFDSGDDSQDFIATQEVELPVREKIKFLRQCSSKLPPAPCSLKNSEDFISTQMFESKSAPPKRQKLASDVPESSGDETDSDLEIIVDEAPKIFPEIRSEASPCESLSLEENHDSNCSYVFQIEDDDNGKKGSGSDATDFEDLDALVRIKQEPFENDIQFEDTQVLTLSLPSNFAQKSSDANNDWMKGQESPKFEPVQEANDFWQVEDPNTEEIETRLHKILNTKYSQEEVPEKKKSHETPSNVRGIDLGAGHGCLSNKPIESPLKRLRDSKNAVEIPVKKPKTWGTENTDRSTRSCEKQFRKLWQAHDISQIQPGRTRNSKREERRDTSPGSNFIYDVATSRRKSKPKNENVDTTIKTGEAKTGRKRAAGPLEENITRVLRSCGRNSANGSVGPPSNRRLSSRKEYFSDACVNVVFTGFNCESLERIIRELGGNKISDLSMGEVVVTDKVRRTVKFLCATALGLPITSPQWLVASRKEGRFLNPWNYILNDEESEEKWDFHLRNSLERAKKTKLLQGFSVYATESTEPPVKDLLTIVECCGGTPLLKRPETWPKKSIIVSCMEDEKYWPLAKVRNVKVVHYEFILSGVLKQKVDFKTYKLR